MRTKRVLTNPDGVLAVFRRKPGQPPELHLNANLVSKAQAVEFELRLDSDRTLLAALGPDA